MSEYGIPLLEILERLLASLLVGAVIGWERERKNKPAGLRTHMLVTLGSATFCVMAFEVGAALSDRYGERGVDPMRVLDGVVGGIGFLGAGSIIQARGRVQGITTAAGVWMAGALGAACGVGAYKLAGLSTVLAFLVLTVLAKVERHLPREPGPEAD
ncbi:MAG TPA: MgtC/SapB family protein [Polyangiaceae bacterium]|jgi:putative Mg2+ transporter-C (MgtC) family protein|nr:MgtC/SapB family protein [Polyangiaceae bacterium]